MAADVAYLSLLLRDRTGVRVAPDTPPNRFLQHLKVALHQTLYGRVDFSLSADQRSQVLALLEGGTLAAKEIAAQTGLSPGTVASIKAHWTMRKQKPAAAPAPTPEPVTAAPEPEPEKPKPDHSARAKKAWETIRRKAAEKAAAEAAAKEPGAAETPAPADPEAATEPDPEAATEPDPEAEETPPEPPHGKFTGTLTDSLGREYHFVNGVRVATAEEVAAAQAEQTPREQAADELAAKQSDYAFARESAVPNVGEDVLGSARHKRNRWTTLENAEKEGTAEELVTREELFRNEPPELLAGVTPENAMVSLAMHLAMQTFPAKPEGKWEHGDAKKRRAQYYEAYQQLKGEAEDIAREEKNPVKALERFHNTVERVIAHLRGAKNVYDRGGSDRYNTVANLLTNTWKRTHPPGKFRMGRTDVGYRLGEFYGLAAVAYPDLDREVVRGTKEPDEAQLALLGKLASHVEDVMEGDSFNKTFDMVKEAGERKGQVKPAAMYVAKAERKGGRKIEAGTVKAGISFLSNDLGMRALQWGNSVSDDERRHHLQRTAEAFADLADVVGLDDKDMSLGGVLAVGFGARGYGTALAHYEPGQKIINLTRKNGVGSLAHEWGHFFDHLLTGGTLSRGLSDRLEGDYFSKRFPHKRMVQEGDKWVPKDNSGDPLMAEFEDWKKAIRSSGFYKRLGEALSAWRAKGMSKGKRDYWRSDIEVFARTFERYVQHKLSESGRANTYLSGFGTGTHWSDGGAPGAELWPTDEETAAMAPAFDAIFAAFKKHRAAFEPLFEKVREELKRKAGTAEGKNG